VLPVAAGAGVVVLLLCLLCGGGGALLIYQGSSGEGLLAGIMGNGTTVELPAESEPAPEPTASATDTATPTTAVDDSTFESPVSPPATPTLPPTSTPTLLPPTNTPPPTDTPAATPVPTDTPQPTDTPEPTPTDTPEAVDTPAPAETPTPEPTATSGPKYGAPALLGPDDGVNFTGINEIILQWQPVENLAADEQYAVRLVYRYNGEVTYGGANVKENQWVVPLKLYQQIDPPENRYEWFVQVERLNEDGSGTAISPESERRSFTWK
jgi:hypothetical protein